MQFESLLVFQGSCSTCRASTAVGLDIYCCYVAPELLPRVKGYGAAVENRVLCACGEGLSSLLAYLGAGVKNLPGQSCKDDQHMSEGHPRACQDFCPCKALLIQCIYGNTE